MKPKIRPKYVARCRNYVHWLGAPGDLFGIDESLPDTAEGEFTAIEAMYLQETHGKVVSCSEPRMLDALYKGKQSREFHIKSWIDMVKQREAWPEEFFGCLGLRSAEEFQSVFGRGLTLPLLRLIHRELGETIERYANILNGSGSGVSSSVVSLSDRRVTRE